MDVTRSSETLIAFQRTTQHYIPKTELFITTGVRTSNPVHNSLPLVPLLSQMTPVHILHLSSPRTILILPSHLHLCLPSGLFHSVFLTKILYGFLFSPKHATHLAHFIIPALNILITSNKACNLLSSSSCSFLQPPIISPFMGQIFSSATSS